MTSGPGDPDRCSAKGCQSPATWQLLWNNPKLHTPERRKVWLACDEHKTSLSDFLGARQFLKDVQPHEPTPAEPASPTDS
ncbi:MAG: acetone carboxylase [Nocardioides sp.]|nr:acetone carboxylase [Nocardioides sp.]